MNIAIKFRKSILLITKIFIVLSVTFLFINTWQTHYTEALFSKNGNYLVVFAFLIIFMTFISLYGGFKVGVSRLHELIYSLTLAVTFTNFVMYMVFCLIARQIMPFWPILIGMAEQILMVFIGSSCANTIYFKLYSARRMIAFFSGDKAGFELIKKMSKIPERYSIERGVSVDTTDMNTINRLLDKYEAVILCDFDKSKKNEILRMCYQKGKRLYILPSSNDIILNNSYQTQVFDTPILMCRNRGLTIEQAMAKRTMDIIIALIGLIVFSPIMIITALCIKICDGGPVFFKQKRITKDNKEFDILKFRSMIVDADKDGIRGASDNDDRITPVGKIIRPFRIDELPQLINVLKGDISMVGPRPERIENVIEYTNELPEFALRHRVKGGLTGYAQIYGKYNTSPQDKLNMDLIYIEKYSLLMDIKLIAMTVKILFMKESTEGFNEPNKK